MARDRGSRTTCSPVYALICVFCLARCLVGMPVKLPEDLKDWTYRQLGKHENTTLEEHQPFLDKRMWKR